MASALALLGEAKAKGLLECQLEVKLVAPKDPVPVQLTVSPMHSKAYRAYDNAVAANKRALATTANAKLLVDALALQLDAAQAVLSASQNAE